jgi:thioredoxin reductase (NADPH)
MYDVIIIGAGCTGWAAAMYAGRFKMKTLIIGDLVGGLITWTDSVENYPGFNKITGTELANKLKEHALEYDVDFEESKVSKVEKTKNSFLIYSGKKKFESKTIILATGTEVKRLNIPGEGVFTNNGVHYCALCDGYAYQNKIISVIGGSDSAAKEALVLAEYGKKVYIIYRGSEIHPEPINLERIKKNKKIEIINNTNLLEIKGNSKVESIILDKAYKGSKELKLDAVFVAIGHTPMSDLAKNIGIKLNNHEEIIIDRDSKTNISGAFAAGDVVDNNFKQAITGVGEAVNAVYSSYQHINNNK